MFGGDKIRDWVKGFEARLRMLQTYLLVGKNAKVSQPLVRMPKRLSLAGQWSVLEDHLQSDISRTQSVLQMQDTATLHLDAAHYALDRIAVELVDVMPSIMTIATVQPPRIYAKQDRLVETTAQEERALAA